MSARVPVPARLEWCYGDRVFEQGKEDCGPLKWALGWMVWLSFLCLCEERALTSSLSAPLFSVSSFRSLTLRNGLYPHDEVLLSKGWIKSRTVWFHSYVGSKTGTHRHRQQYGGYQRERGCLGVVKSKGGQLYGDRRWFDSGGWAHSTIYRRAS